MKKLIFTLALLSSFLIANAENVKIEIENATVQAGAPATLNVMMTSDIDLAACTFYVVLPEEAEVTLNEDNNPNISFLVSGSSASKFEFGGTELSYGVMSTTNVFKASASPVKIATIDVTAPANAGTYDIKVYRIGYSNAAGSTDVLPDDNASSFNSTLTVQRAAVINQMDASNDIEIIPQTLVAGTTDNALPLYLNNAKNASSVEATLVLPEGFSVTLEEGEPKCDDPNDDRLYYTAAKYAHYVSIEANETGTYDFSIASNKAASYIYPSANNADIFTKLYLDVDKSVAPGVYTIKFKDITLSADDDYKGDYYFSVFVGTPTETDPVVYGHYTAAGVEALKSVKGARTIDMTSAIVEKGVSDAATIAAAIEGTLIQGAEQTAYKRTNATYSTLCLPYEIDATAGEYYTVESIDTKSITIKEATGKIAANTPVIFKGTVAPAANVSVYPGTAGTVETGASTFTGTYETVDLKAGEGYYISGGKFYGDGAEVAPFRAYFAGAIAGVKNLSILIDTEDGLIDITDQLSNEDIYDLAGRKLDKTRKGVNIIGGKKVLVK